MKFADTSWWVAYSVASDERHEQAVETRRMLRDGEQICTTGLVIGETWTYLRRKVGHAAAVGFVDRADRLVARSELRLLDIDADIERRAWVFLRRRDEREYSFVDATSFEVMKAHRIREALAFDGDFSAAGFVEMRPPMR